MVFRVVITGLIRVGISVDSIVANWLLCYIQVATRLDIIVPKYWSAAS